MDSGHRFIVLSSSEVISVVAALALLAVHLLHLSLRRSFMLSTRMSFNGKTAFQQDDGIMSVCSRYGIT